MHHTVQLTGKRRLSRGTEELRFERPPELAVSAGQKIRFFQQETTRDYTLVNAPDRNELVICVREVVEGRFSPWLVRAPIGTAFRISAPFGYFTYQPSVRQAVFVATGTGIAPFVAFVRSGVSGFCLLHGVRSEEQLYYREELAAAAHIYVACLSTEGSGAGAATGAFPGRVTLYLEKNLPVGSYDFYLCGLGAMIEAATHIIDRRFPGALVFTEPFD
jgi:benzoate/toluate 1,2-dioxygenase reductase component